MEHQGLFAQVNDSIRKVASQGPEGQTWEFLCECPDLACHACVTLTLREFDDRRSSARPVLAQDHLH